MSRQTELKEMILDQTLPSDSGLGSASVGDKTHLPLQGWDRFHITRELGRGGMGRVYQAHDPRLNRKVAIKLLNENSARNFTRFVREARYQANVDHAHVCSIFEAGMEDGHAYIAMQYIQGMGLQEACRDMDLERILLLFQQIAMGLHAAHSIGLIHRDIKPGNIMVELPEEGLPHAYILDFGLARDQNDPSMTRTGDVMGTLAFMPPEQARGEISKLDRRSDVYSLGASLFAILSGSPPIDGRVSRETLEDFISGEITPLRQLAPSLPRDVETLVMKCLEKSPRKRYDSAQAFSDDVGRYLKGEHLLARPASFWERLGKKAARHKNMVATGLVALLLLMLSLSWGVYGRRQTAAQKALIASFTAKVENMRALARLMYMSPLHNLTENRKLIREHMAIIQAEMDQLGPTSFGPGHFALGCGYMELKDSEKALFHLQKAWDMGFQEPRVAYVLSRALGDQYRRGLMRTSLIRSASQRALRKEDVSARFREPALKYAQLASRVKTQFPAYPEALIAYFEGDNERAEQLLTLKNPFPWFYETHQLLGDIFTSRALDYRDADSEKARASFRKARSSYQQALNIAPSDPNLYLNLAELHYWRMLMELYGKGDPKTYLNQGISLLSDALKLKPEWDEALLLEASFYRRFGEYNRNGANIDTSLWFDKSMERCQLILQRQPRHSQANYHLGLALSQTAQLEKAENKDPSPHLKAALEAFSLVAASDQDYLYFNNIGLVHKTQAEYNARVGREYKSHRMAEIDAYNRTVELNETTPSPLINKASALLDMITDSTRPENELEEAVSALGHALKLAPEHLAANLYMGRVLSQLARYKNLAGHPYAPDQDRALQYFDAGGKLAPKLPHFPNGQAALWLDRGRMDWQQGKDPAPGFSKAIAYCQQAIDLAPSQVHAQHNLGEVYRNRALVSLNRGDNPEADLRLAEEAYGKALQLAPNFAPSLSGMGKVYCLRADHLLIQGESPKASIHAAQKVFEQAAATNPKDDAVFLDKGRLDLVRARYAYREGADWRFLCDRALNALRASQARGLALEELRLEMALAYHQTATWMWENCNDPMPYIDKGIEVSDRILETRALAKATAIGADLRWLRANVGVEQGDLFQATEVPQEAGTSKDNLGSMRE